MGLIAALGSVLTVLLVVLRESFKSSRIRVEALEKLLAGRFRYLQNGLLDLRDNHLKHLDEKLDKLFDLHAETQALCADRGERMARCEQRLDDADRRLTEPQ
jgi:hypothetical protein